MWPPPLPAAPVIKLQCSAAQCSAVQCSAVQFGADHNHALGSERELIGINWAEQFIFEYWSHSS